MHRRRAADDEEDTSEEEEEDSGDEEDDSELEGAEEEPPRRPSRGRTHPGPPRPRPARPLRRWRSAPEGSLGEVEESQVELEQARELARIPKANYWRFRDSYLFAPLVAIVVIALVVGGLLVYTQNWPPIYVVESGSMQHGPNDVVGAINAGDLVLSQKVSVASIRSYVSSIPTGYTTYGELGDVILYQPNGGSGTPVIHRAILYLEYNPNNGTYSAPSLVGLPCGGAANAVYNVSGSLTGCGPYGMHGTLTLYRIGWQSASVPILLSSNRLGQQSGYVTLGDNNFENPGCSRSACVGDIDQNGLSHLVTSGWIVGVARGMLPWFGAVRLLIGGNAGAVPSQSWQLLALSVIGIVLAAFALHYAWRSFRRPDRRRAAVDARRVEEEEGEEAEAERTDEVGPRRRWFHRRARDEEEELHRERDERAQRGSRRRGTGRPPPKVWRPPKEEPVRRRPSHDDEEL